MIALGDQAEQYIEYQQIHGHGGDSVRDTYDVEQSRREWAQDFQ